MFIVPFTHNIVKHNQNNINIHIIRILTVGGRQLWEENSKLDVDNDILIPNDIYRTGDIIKFGRNIKLCKINTNKTNINDYYKWDEISINDTDTFCWRTIIQFIDINNNNWLNIPYNEKIDRFLLNDIINTIIKTNKVI
jgi:hypothetical protein